MKPSQSLPPEQSTPHSIIAQLASGQSPLVDVRAPGEFNQAHLPHSINLPILNDEERHQVGLTYKRLGNVAATELGHQLVSGEVRQQRIEAWANVFNQQSDARLICWRGGARSRIAQSWLNELGIPAQRIPGGYKTLRQACLAVLEQTGQKHWWVLGGKTGVGKTVAIGQIPSSIDLEGIARHRGSAFGSYPDAQGHSVEQPAQATFENLLAYAWLQLASAQIVVEDESRMIGRTALPKTWHEAMHTAPLVLIDATLEERSAHIYQEYVEQPLAAGTSPTLLKHHLQKSLQKISRRLGGQLHQQIHAQLTQAFDERADHTEWITSLLSQYYDPMYEYQLQKKTARVVFQGSLESAVEYLKAQTTPTD